MIKGFNFQIKKISDLGEKERGLIKKFLIDVYSDNPDYKNSVYSNPDLNTCVLMFHNNELIGHTSITRRLVNINHKDFLVSGIGDVAIKPKPQRKGYGKLLMNKVSEVTISQDYDLGLLFCHPKLHQFYTDCGWTKKENGKVFALKHGQPEDQRLTYFLPLKLNQKDKLMWNNADIIIGEGSW